MGITLIESGHSHLSIRASRVKNALVKIAMRRIEIAGICFYNFIFVLIVDGFHRDHWKRTDGRWKNTRTDIGQKQTRTDGRTHESLNFAHRG